MTWTLQGRAHYPRTWLAVLVLSIAAGGCHAQITGSGPECSVTIESLKDSTPFSLLDPDKQARVVRALRDDITEMAGIDVESTSLSRAAYRDYFISHLQYKYVPGMTPAEQLLLVRYDSNTICGQYDNCPVWIVRLARGNAKSMVPWQDEHLGTSAGGGWGVSIQPLAGSEYPDLILLTYLSSVQTGLACYRESKGRYLRRECPPDCARLLSHSSGQN